jgi:hypothetical protein
VRHGSSNWCDQNRAHDLKRDPLNGELVTATTGPDLLSSSVLSAINTTNQVQTVRVVVSDTDFVAPVSQFAAAASSTWQNAIGSAKANNSLLIPPTLRARA